MKRIRRFSSCGVALATLLISSHAFCQNLDGAGSDLTKLLGIIRWSGVALSVLVWIGAAIFLRFSSGVASQLSERFAHRRLTLQKLESFTRFAVYFLTGAVVIALSFRLNDTLVTVLGGTLAVALGFAMRDLVAAMIAGVTIMFDRPFQVGDRVEYAGQYGDITKIGLRSVRMQTLDDNTVTIPNNKILTDVTSCGNYGALDMQVAVVFYVGVDQDIELAEQLVTEAFLTSRYVFLDKPIVVLLRQVLKDDFVALEMKGKAYVLDTKYEKAFESDVTKRTLLAFQKAGIRPPTSQHQAVEKDAGPRGSAWSRTDEPKSERTSN